MEVDRNDIWNILGIEKNSDRKAIRRAYAAQARLHHPEEEPEYFTMLNQAYQEALEYAAGAGKTTEMEYAEAGNIEKAEHTESAAWDEKAEHTEPAAEIGKAEHMEVTECAGKAGHGESAERIAETSLLDRLQSAETRRIQESLQTGALRDFITLFENTKQNKQADTWKRFFLTESFLSEQFQEEFGKGLLEYLKNQQIQPYDNLPMGLLQELDIAYAFIPHFAGAEYFEGKKYPKEWYKVSVEKDSPGAAKYIAEIFNFQGVECDLKSMTGHILRQPALKVRHNAFSDYVALKEMNRRGMLTESECKTWQPLLRFAKVHHLYERNGKSPRDGDGEARGECLIKLYVQWFKDERIPECVLKFLYRELAFKDLDHSSTRGLYGALKEQVLRQCPNLETLLFDGESKEQALTKLHKACVRILNDNQTNYEKSIYEETPEIRRRVSDFFAMPEWQKYQEDRELFDKLYSVLCRLVIPRSMAEHLTAVLERKDFPEPKRSRLMESLLRSLSTEKLCREFDYKCEVNFAAADRNGMVGDSEEFWQYFFLRGFGYRHVRAWNFGEEEADYVLDGEAYLPAYIQYMYAPSRTWQKQFTGFDEEREIIENPISASYRLPEGKTLRVEFHYHYCLYFLEEVQVAEPVFSFQELCRYGEGLERAEHFFFLLAVTAIEERERKDAEALIAKWLEKVPVHGFLRPFLARLLAADNDRIVLPASIIYMESERFCFRAVVSEISIKIFRQTDYGWEDKIFREKAFGWKEYLLPEALQHSLDGLPPVDFEGRKQAAHKILDSLRQPAPVCRASCSLEGMDTCQKAAAILNAMDLQTNPEGYCVLHYGEHRHKRHTRVFYAAIAPFGFSVKEHAPAYERSLEYSLAVSRTKIKENKWLLGHFGWGFKYSTKSDFGPVSVWVGESGTYYACGAIKTHRADNLAALLAELYRGELEGVTAVETFEGYLTVSRLDHRLEYCYTEEDFRQAIHGREKTVAEAFTLFGRYPLWRAFAGWLDGILEKGLPSWVNLIRIGLDEENGEALKFIGVYYEETEEEEDEDEDEAYDVLEEELGDEDFEDSDIAEGADSEEYKETYKAACGAGERDGQIYQPETERFLWERDSYSRHREESLYEAVCWYMECGTYAEVLKEKGISVAIGG